MTSVAYAMQRLTDLHVHARAGEMLARVARPSLLSRKYATIMPNLDPPIETIADAERYEREIISALDVPRAIRPQLIMALYLVPHTTPQTIRAAHARRGPLVTVKYYPYGTTTLSQFGIKNLRDGYQVFETMQEVDMVLNLHGEVAGFPSFPDAEQRFLEQMVELHEAFPDLRIVLEHVSSAEAVNLILELPNNIAGSITPQHMCLTIDDVEQDGEVEYPHHACLPRAKTAADRDAVLTAALRSMTFPGSKFFKGSDSAPHDPSKKHKGEGCANGVYSGPFAAEVLAQVFETSGYEDWPDRLEYFGALAGPDFMKLPRPDEDDIVYLVREDWQVPPEVNGIVPFMAGEMLRWKMFDNELIGRL